MKRAILCHIEDYRYVEEYIASIRPPDMELVIYSSPPSLDPTTYYMCMRRIPDGSGLKAFINTEQLTVPQKVEEYKAIIVQHCPIDVYDYALKNCEISSSFLGQPSSYLPYYSPPAEQAQLRQWLSVPKETDVCVLGTPSVKRQRYVDTLREAGITVDYVYSLFGEERDRQIGKSRILVNIHYSEEYVLYESIRCERWRVAGMPVVSEVCVDSVPVGVEICELSTVVEVVRKTLASASASSASASASSTDSLASS
jgi:hypothetical protein